jgi:polyhydroxybutyrate depolymerase
VPVAAFHGTADEFVGYDGGFGEGASRLPAPDGSDRTMAEASPSTSSPPPKGPSVPEITTAWAKRNGCETEPIEKQISSDTTLMTFSCPKGAEVELYTTEGGGHSWPGSEFSKSVVAVVGKTTETISANELMWEFFQAHPLPRS